MLTDLTIRSAPIAAKPYKLTDGNGLYIEIFPSGSKLWRYRYRIDGKENTFALGRYSSKPSSAEDKEARLAQGIFTLAEAREERVKARALVKQGIHPSHDRKFAAMRRRTQNDTSFKAVAKLWLNEPSHEWSDLYRKNLIRGLDKDVMPYIGAMKVADVEPYHILDIADRIKERSPITAKLTCSWISAIFRFAILRLMTTVDPTFPLQGLIKVPKAKHHRPLETEHIGRFIRSIEAADVWIPTVKASQLLWLTLVRKNELIKASWSEFDLEEKLWRIPGPRMKMGKDHIVPLSRQALAIIESMRPISGSQPFVFPSQMDSRKPLGTNAIYKLFRDIGNEMKFASAFTPHGVRSTFSTLANGAMINPDVIELCLAHQGQDAVRDAYNRALLLPQRTTLMQRWADMLDAFRDGKTKPLLDASKLGAADVIARE